MSLFRNIAGGLRSLFHRQREERELSEELREFLEMAAQEKEKQGLSRQEGLRAVRLERGNAELAKQVVRDSGWESVLETCWQDVRFGVRMLRRSPGFTVVAVITLALGIGANTAIFSLINALMLRTATARDPATLVELLRRYQSEPAYNGFSWDAYQILRQNHVLSDLLVAPTGIFDVRGRDLEPHSVFGGYLSGTYFEMLGLQPATGRLIGTEADDLSHPSPVAVVSWTFWKNNFSLDPAIVGKQIVVNETPVTIIGVAQQGFNGLNEEASQEVWLPLSIRPKNELTEWNALALLGRLKPGVTLEHARTELAVLFQSAVQAPGVGPYVREMKFELHPAASGLSNPLREMLRTPVLVLMAITGLVLLVACANLAGLLLARGTARRHEMALRVCLGAGRFRLVRQALTESLLLSLFGSLFGVLLAYVGGRALLRMVSSGRDIVGLPAHMHAEVLARPDAHVLWYTGAITVVTALLFGILPAMGLSAQPALALQQVARIGESRSRRLLGKGLIVVQVAVSTVLLSVAVLLVGYMSHLRTADLGFRRDHLLLLQLDPSHSGYDAARLSRLCQELLVRLEALPGVRSATFSATTPMLGAGASSFATAKDHPDVHRQVVINYVAPRYFETYGTPLIAGRDFAFSDEGGPLVAVINEAMARDFFRGRDPISRYMTLDHVTLRGNDTPTYQIVGVVGDAKYNYLQQPAPRTIYLHAFQEGRVASKLTLGTAVTPESVVNAVRERIASDLRTVPIVRSTTMTDQIDAAIVPERLEATLSSCFGVLGALLAAVGLYGLLAYSVLRRTNEIGVRLALGATRRDVLRIILAEALVMVGAGLTIGVPIAFWTKQTAARLIPDLTVKGSVWILSASAMMLVITLLAALLPARRATRVDPMVALRYE